MDGVRELERLAALRPAEAPVKVFIVDEAERMTLATPQAFLKTLEEPPARTVIVLILAQPRALPATVLSRCQIVRFLPAPAEGTLALLPDGRGEARARALELLAKAEAGGGDAVLAARRGPGPRPRGGGNRGRDLLALVPGPSRAPRRIAPPLVFAERADAVRPAPPRSRWTRSCGRSPPAARPGWPSPATSRPVSPSKCS